MNKEVRMIFNVLLGTVILIVVSALIAEIVNISVSSLQLQQMTKSAARQSCILFAQETYKTRDTSSAGSINMQDILDPSGGVYVTGTFYAGNNVESIFKDLYDVSNGAEFKHWVEEYGQNWKNVNYLYRYLNNDFEITETPDPNNYMDGSGAIDYDRYLADVDKYTEYAIAKSYIDNYVTPLNFGVPYMDKDTLTAMFRWNLTQILSNCDSDNIRVDKYGNTYTAYSGFRVYSDQAEITALNYTVYDLNSEVQKAEFEQLTHINPDKLAFSEDVEYIGTEEDERKKICVIGVEYNVPVSYSGVTYLDTMIGWLWDSQVEGLEGDAPEIGDNTFNYGEQADLVGGGFNGNEALEGVLPVPGKLIYYVVR